MPDVLLEVRIAAPPDEVYKAITEQEGLSRWWTPETTAQPTVGSVAEFAFTGGPGGRFVVRMEVTTLEPGRKVYWTVKEGAGEWAGTHVTWDLTPVDTGTSVRFGHRGYASTEGSFAGVGYNWAWYLTSLKDYLETGEGRPDQLFGATRDYTKRMHVEAPPEAVYSALTSLSGLAGWWAPVSGSGVEGGELRFSMGFEDPLVIDVATALRPSTVIWSVRACAFLPDWVGTSPSFTLSNSDTGGCDLQFLHKGLTPQLECYGLGRKGWDQYLPSLHDYVQSGRGNPME